MKMPRSALCLSFSLSFSVEPSPVECQDVLVVVVVDQLTIFFVVVIVIVDHYWKRHVSGCANASVCKTECVS